MADRPALNAESGIPELWVDNGDGTYSLTVSADTGAVGLGDLPVWNVLRGVVERWKTNGGGTWARCVTTTPGAGTPRLDPDTGLVEKYVSQQSGAYFARLVTTTDGAGVTVVDGSNGIPRKYVYNGDGTYSELVAASGGAGVTGWNDGAGAVEKFVGSGPYARLLSGLVAVLPPVADFSGNPLAGAGSVDTQFTDLSSPAATAWHWEFNQGGAGWTDFTGTPTVQNPEESFVSAGSSVISIRLTATNAGGSNTKTRTNYITIFGG